MAAQYIFGDQAAATIRDATWVFTDISSYERFFKLEEDRDCDIRCVRGIVSAMRPHVKAVVIGTPVRVVRVRTDPDAPQYQVCQITGGAVGWTICTSLRDQP